MLNARQTGCLLITASKANAMGVFSWGDDEAATQVVLRTTRPRMWEDARMNFVRSLGREVINFPRNKSIN